MVNLVCVSGRFIADPVLRQTTSGVSTVSFMIAVDRDYKDDEGKRPADFIPCVAWKGTAEHICRNFVKGQPITITGELRSRRYEKDGVNREVLEVMVVKAYFAGPKPLRTEDTVADLDDVKAALAEFKELKDEEDGDLPF